MKLVGDTKQMLSDAKFFEAYSRFNPESGTYETWDDSVSRVMEMHRTFYKDVLNDELEFHIKKAENAYKGKIVLGAQRALQFGGEQLLKHQLKLYNCLSSYVDRPEVFGEVFYALLCGCGTGFSVQKHHVAKLSPVQVPTKQAKVYHIDDTIEGWASSVDVLLSSYFVDGGKHTEYQGRKVYFDLKRIRQKGSFISGGFKAPGPEPLRRALDRIDMILYNAACEKRQLKTIEVYDILMHIADAVISGGVRRSATICLFSLDDEDMINAKTGNWFQENQQRKRSNNSAVVVRHLLTRAKFDWIMDKVKEFGEPGFFFVDSTEITTNPCVEIGMLPHLDGVSGWQGCNLTEVNGSFCDSEENFYMACEAAAILGTLQAGYTKFRFMTETTQKIFEREALLGVSITGWMNNPDILFSPKILERGAEIVKKTNKKVAALLGINAAARTTCVKPSGNASVLLMTASGIHPEHSANYFRLAQMNKESEVVKLIKEKNPHMVEESIWSSDGSDYVVYFPIVSKEGSIYKSALLGVEHLEKVKLAQKYWVNGGTNVDLCVDKRVRHNVSNTIIVDDWEKVTEYVFENREFFAGISFMPAMGDKVFNQAPFTKVALPQEILDCNGTASMFASGLIVDAINAFGDLWLAIETVHGRGEDITMDSHVNTLKKDWCRRFDSFSDNYFESARTATENCLKDVFLLHKWMKIQNNFVEIDWISDLHEKAFTDIDTMGAAACSGGACEIDF